MICIPFEKTKKMKLTRGERLSRPVYIRIVCAVSIARNCVVSTFRYRYFSGKVERGKRKEEIVLFEDKRNEDYRDSNCAR